MASVSNKVVIIDEAKFNPDQDRHWQQHALYSSFTETLDEDFQYSLSHRRRAQPLYIHALQDATQNYALFQVYLKIVSQTGTTVDHLQFRFDAVSPTSVACVVDIHYTSGFIQTIIITASPSPQSTPTSTHPHPHHQHAVHQKLKHAVQQERVYNHDCLPVTIEHRARPNNALHTDTQWPISNRMETDIVVNDSNHNNNTQQAASATVEHDDDDDDDERSILWRFYEQKQQQQQPEDEEVVWPTYMDDTFFADRADIVRSDEQRTRFTFVGSNPEFNRRRYEQLKRNHWQSEGSDAEDQNSDSNEVPVNFRSNVAIPRNVFMYYFEVTASHNLEQPYFDTPKFKRCYFGLLPQSKIHLPTPPPLQFPHEEDALDTLYDIFSSKLGGGGGGGGGGGVAGTKTSDKSASAKTARARLPTTQLQLPPHAQSLATVASIASSTSSMKFAPPATTPLAMAGSEQHNMEWQRMRRKKKAHLKHYLRRMKRVLRKSVNASNHAMPNVTDGRHDMEEEEEDDDEEEGDDDADDDDEDWFDSDDEHRTRHTEQKDEQEEEEKTCAAAGVKRVQFDVAEDTATKSKRAATTYRTDRKQQRKEKRVLRDQCVASMKEYDRMFYNLWSDEPALYSDDDDDEDHHKHASMQPDSAIALGAASAAMKEADKEDSLDASLEILTASFSSKYKPTPSDDAAFVTQVFDSKQLCNDGVCVKVHSSLLTVSRKLLYPDEHFNQVCQQSQWKRDQQQQQQQQQSSTQVQPENADSSSQRESGRGRDEDAQDHDDDDDDNEDDDEDDEDDDGDVDVDVHTQPEHGDDQSMPDRTAPDERGDDDDEDEEEEKDKIGIDGWQRVDDETFYLTKPANFEKRIHLSLSQPKRKRKQRAWYKPKPDDNEDRDDATDDSTDNDDGEEGESEEQFMSQLRLKQEEYGVDATHAHDGNVLLDGLDSFTKTKTKSLKWKQKQTQKRFHLRFNNDDDKQRKERHDRWTDRDKHDVKRTRDNRRNKQVAIVKKLAPCVQNHDVIGIGLNFRQRTMFVTCNGKLARDKQYNEPLIFRDLCVDEPLYIVGVLRHFGNQLAFNFGQRKFQFDLGQYFRVEYLSLIRRNQNYMARFARNQRQSARVKQELLANYVLDHCIYEGYQSTVHRLLLRMFGVDHGHKLVQHLHVCNAVFSTMHLRRSIKSNLEHGHLQGAKQQINKLKICYFAVKYPVAWFQILRQELIEFLRDDRMTDALHLYENEILGFYSFLISDENPHRLNLDDKNRKTLQNEVDILAMIVVSCARAGGLFDIKAVATEYRYLFDVHRRYLLRDVIHQLLYQHMQQREHKRLTCLYGNRQPHPKQQESLTLKMYDSQLNLFLKHLCAVHDCFKTNFANYLENIRFV